MSRGTVYSFGRKFESEILWLESTILGIKNRGVMLCPTLKLADFAGRELDIKFGGICVGELGAPFPCSRHGGGHPSPPPQDMGYRTWSA